MTNEPIKLLDHGLVRLVDHMGDDMTIVRSARVSYNAEPRNDGSDAKLINYLMKNRHTSPFEAVSFLFEVKAPIFVFRQWHRHRTWCLGGETPIIFNRPCDGRPYRMNLVDVVRKWNPSAPKRQRQERTLSDWNRERMSSMHMRAPGGDVSLQDAWFSGEKPVYRLRTAAGEVVASAAHVFKTPSGSARIEDSPTEVMAMVSVGDARPKSIPVLSSNELANEIWREFVDGYEVSNLGRVRSYFGQGARRKRLIPILKNQTVNRGGRLIVGVENKAVPVSRLVAQNFVSGCGPMVLHNDDNPLDNRASNLRWGSAKDNQNDSYVNGGRVHLREVPVKVDAIERVGTEPTFDITVTGDHWFVADNLVVHNSYNEVSARYTELPEEFYIPDAEQITTQSDKNKQMRTTEPHPRAKDWQEMMFRVNRESFTMYRAMLDDGVPRELARSVLPVATYSHMFASVDLHNLFGFLKLRLHEHAQYEIRVYATAMLELIRPIVPVAVAAFLEHGL
jgi:flavin-dependent thymidylate synthase